MRRRATGRSAAQAGRFAIGVQRRRSATQSASRGRKERSDAQRAKRTELFARGCSRSAQRRNGRRGVSGSRPELERRRAGRGGVLEPAPSGGRTGVWVTARSATPGLPGERAGTASAGPCGPGRRERSDRSRRPSNASGRADPPPRHQAKRLPWFVRRLRRGRQPAGRSGVPAGHDRAGTTRGNEAQRSGRVTCRRGSYRSAAFVADTSATRRPRRGRTLPDRSEAKGGSRDRDRSEELATESWRETCRLVDYGDFDSYRLSLTLTAKSIVDHFHHERVHRIPLSRSSIDRLGSLASVSHKKNAPMGEHTRRHHGFKF